jgi:hypothetical protein
VIDDIIINIDNNMILYHYTSGQGIFGIINSKQLHCSNVRFLNDPSEHSLFKEIVGFVIKDCSICNKIYKTFYNESYQDVILNPTDKFIASFSKNNDSLSMWNYYAKGNGYNIGFDIDTIIKNNHKKKVFIQKVELIYDRSEQIRLTRDFILTFESKLELYENLRKKMEHSSLEEDYYKYDQESHWLIEEFNDGIFELMICFKHEAYKTEEEIRLIITQDQWKEKYTDFKVSESGVFIEFISLGIDLKQDIKNVTIHPLNGEIHTQGTRQFLNSKIGYEKVNILLSKIPFRII